MANLPDCAKDKRGREMIMLGNLTIDDMENRLGIQFPEDMRIFLRNTKQEEASNISSGKWHCFDLPFHLVCGDIETATKIYNSVKDKSSEVKEPLQISIQK